MSTQTTTTTTNSWAKGKDGSWLVRGAAGQRGRAVAVTKRDGSVQTVVVAREVWTDGTVALYAVESSAAQATTGRASNYDRRPSAGYRPACKTGGNCSSFGSGRDCGGRDCDGF